MKFLDKILLWIFPTLLRRYEMTTEDYDKYVRKIKELKDEIEYNQSYIKTLEDCVNEYKKTITTNKEILKFQKTHVKIRSQEGWHFIDDLPSHSIPECIVTDGEIVQTVQYDHHTKQFLKVFGSQSLYVGKPVAWMPMPLPPNDHKGYIENYKSISSRHALTYNR